MIRSMAHFLHGELERNWACHETPYFEQRHENIAAMPNPGLRLGEYTMLAFARSYPNATSKILNRTVDPANGFRLAGAGSKHTVLTDEALVLKIHRQSSFMRSSQQTELATQYNHDHAVLRNYLGSMVVQQTTRVDANPLDTHKNAVVSEQPYHNFEVIDIFEPYNSDVDLDKLDLLLDKNPGLDTALYDLGIKGIELYHSEGLLPDTSGLHNVVISGGELRYLGGLPLRPMKSSEITRLVGQLQTLVDYV